MTRLLLGATVLFAGLLAGVSLDAARNVPAVPTAAERAPRPGAEAVGVLVEQTADASPATLRAARAEVERLRAAGVPAELRVTRSPSEALGAAATLAARGAERLVTYGADRSVVDPLRARGVTVIERR